MGSGRDFQISVQGCSTCNKNDNDQLTIATWEASMAALNQIAPTVRVEDASAESSGAIGSRNPLLMQLRVDDVGLIIIVPASKGPGCMSLKNGMTHMTSWVP